MSYKNPQVNYPRKPKLVCPKCGSDKNIVKQVAGYFCTYCQLKFYGGDDEEQQKLN